MEDQLAPKKPTYEDVSALAYRLWQDEGQPTDKAEEHWRRAEEQLQEWHSPVPEEGEAGLPPNA